jgi:hypothetical protein
MIVTIAKTEFKAIIVEDDSEDVEDIGYQHKLGHF